MECIFARASHHYVISERLLLALYEPTLERRTALADALIAAIDIEAVTPTFDNDPRAPISRAGFLESFSFLKAPIPGNINDPKVAKEISDEFERAVFGGKNPVLAKAARWGAMALVIKTLGTMGMLVDVGKIGEWFAAAGLGSTDVGERI